VSKRQLILDGAVIAFAKNGFHGSRVSDIAQEADVAYGLVYHYFDSKDEILDTLFLDRWEVLLKAIAENDSGSKPAEEKLYGVASFIIDSYRSNPELMQVIIVEVTRAANTFGRKHIAKITEAFNQITKIVKSAQASGEFRSDVSPEFAALTFYGAIEQILTAWIFGQLPTGSKEFDHAKHSLVDTVCRGLKKT